jgi:hypothetical protein
LASSCATPASARQTSKPAMDTNLEIIGLDLILA